MNLRPALAASACFAAVALVQTGARAAACQVNACTNEILSAAGVVVNDIFRDVNGHDALHLPLYGKIVDNWPGCPEHVDFAGAGHSVAPYNCPGQYTTDSTSATVASANQFLAAVDRYWWQPCRLGDPSLTDIGGGTMCVANWSCITDGVGGNYNPWQGMVFDLGGPSNQVAIFAENDHGPQPCESLEYTVFLSDNLAARDQVLDPKTQGVDPSKWNRAVLSKIYTWGWITTRAPDPANYGPSCGDTSAYSVEEDSFVQVFSLPCGITFRYASVVAGNDGRDFPSCAYDSNEGEIDAVAGLTESGAAVCPDADGDLYVDCNCPGHPTVCDCDDADVAVHPGAPEVCDAAKDLNCDGAVGTPCGADLICYSGICIPTCSGGENPFCPGGSTCQQTPQGKACVPADCTTAGCPAGSVCTNGVCVPACSGVVCPGHQVCQDGACIDPCANLVCPAGQLCQGGQCVSPCNCFQGDIGCGTTGDVCDTGSSNVCVPPACKGIVCQPGETCDPTTGICETFCNVDTKCPAGQKCVEPDGCVPVCKGVTCPDKWTCDQTTGVCVDTSCEGISCFSPQVCVAGQCVTPDGGTGGGGFGGGGSGGAGGTTTSTPSGSSGAGDAGEKSGCGCRLPGEEAPLSCAGALALLGLAALTVRRRR